MAESSEVLERLARIETKLEVISDKLSNGKDGPIPSRCVVHSEKIDNIEQCICEIRRIGWLIVAPLIVSAVVAAAKLFFIHVAGGD